jgi:hypothetical protein
MGMCVYNNRCPLQAEYKWVKACTGNKNKAMCSVCMKSIDLSKIYGKIAYAECKT